jgi:hypothetical protein
MSAADPSHPAAVLIAEQFSHAVDLLKADLNVVKLDRGHDRELFTHRLEALEGQAQDFERRLRSLTDSATQFRFLVSLAAGGGLLSLVSLLRALFAGQP